MTEEVNESDRQVVDKQTDCTARPLKQCRFNATVTVRCARIGV